MARGKKNPSPEFLAALARPLSEAEQKEAEEVHRHQYTLAMNRRARQSGRIQLRNVVKDKL